MKLFIFLVFILGCIRVSADTPFLPSFSAIAALMPKQKEQYLSSLVNVWKKSAKQDPKLSKLGTYTERGDVICFTGIFGVPGKTQARTGLINCRQDLNKAASYFLNPENQPEWERFRVQSLLTCRLSKKCSMVVKEESLIRENCFSGKTVR